MKKNAVFSTLSLVALLAVGCSEQGGFASIGGSILSSTGLVSSSQAEALFKSGEKLSKAYRGLTPKEEHYLGRGVAALILSKYKPLRNDAINSYVTKVGLVVASASTRPETFGGYHFLVLDTNEINALSAPGGFVFITRGLLQLMPDEDALAAVLAHEVAHVASGDGMAAISEGNVKEALLIVGKEAASSQGGAIGAELVGAFGSSIDEVYEAVVSNGYSRRQEYSADQYAVAVLKQSHYNPNGLVTMLKRLESTKAGEGGLFATHPKPNDRIDNVEDGIGKGGDTAGQSVRAARFRAIVGKSA